METIDLALWNPELLSIRIEQICIDSRAIDSKCALFVALKGRHQDGHDFVIDAKRRGAVAAIVEQNWKPPKGLNLQLIFVESPLKALQEIATTYRCTLNTKILAITGSYGKTLTKDLIEQFLATTSLHFFSSPESFNSQIGIPLSLLQIEKKQTLALIEVGISHPGEMDSILTMVEPDYVVITNIGDAHISSLKSIEVTAHEKAKLLQSQNLQWALTPKEMGKKTLHWDLNNHFLPHLKKIDYSYDGILPYEIHFPDGTTFQGRLSETPLYILDCIQIAIQVAWKFGVTIKGICSVLKDYTYEPRQTEWWKTPSGATFIHPSYCSDIQSVNRALKYLSKERKRIVVFGGFRGGKEHHYKQVGSAFSRANVEEVYLWGKKPFQPLIDQINSHKSTISIYQSSTFTETLEILRQKIDHDELVLIQGPQKKPLKEITETFYDSIHTNQLTINLSILQQNLERIQASLPTKTRLMPMVKADGYGSDPSIVAQFLSNYGIDIFGLSYVDEAVGLRRAGISNSLFVLNTTPNEVVKVVKWNLEVGVSDLTMIEKLGMTNHKIKIHLHVDTGMSRLGCRPEEALQIARKITQHPNLILEGVFTHFACADDPKQDAFTHKQAKVFSQVIETLEQSGISIPWKHISNSSAAMRFPNLPFNMARIGLALFGLPPSQAAYSSCPIKLALSLTSQVVGINTCLEGETVSYARSYTIKRNQGRIAVIPIGYFDGIHRHYSGKGEVLIRGKRAPMVGNICMDYMMVDVSHIPEAKVGDSVLIFGKDPYGNVLDPTELSSSGNTIPYELITCLGPRIQRVFIAES